MLFGSHRDRLGVARGRTGAIAVAQRFRSALNLNPHVHTLLLDGVYDAAAAFHRLTPPTIDEVGVLVNRVSFETSSRTRTLPTRWP